jgi:unsaturated rhamnogalacturonyl hydrolase
MIKQFYICLFLLFNFAHLNAQISTESTWVDSMDQYALYKFLPAQKYKWTWQNASLLNVVVKQYESSTGEKQKQYFDYIKTAMDKSMNVANGRMPNSVASGLGMAFLYRVTKDEKYKAVCDKILADYKKARRTKESAISHIPVFTELWDDTVFMIGEFLLAMYRATGDETYLDELALQIKLHRSKLQDPSSGLWVHGWDQAGWGHCAFCSQVRWADKKTYRSQEVWGRGNGWIVVTLSDALQIIPKSNPHWNTFAAYLNEMIVNLPALQDTQTGHWYQLPLRKGEKGNFIESSSTAMFAYGIKHALNMGIVNGANFENAVDLAYEGLRNHSVAKKENGFLTSKNVCTATCIGNKKYYFKRGVQQGKAYGLASFIQFGRLYEAEKK